MGYVIQAVLSSAQHPEYGQITIPFPIPREEYDHTIELLEPLGIGDTLRQDCQVDELDSFYTVVNELTGKSVTLDELDYLAKRLDSFDDGEAAQFQGMAHKLGITQIKDFINLTFCCQRATVITDFSDLKEIGQEHYMNLNGGSASMEALENLDGVETALLLIDRGAGTVTPYGVVYTKQASPWEGYRMILLTLSRGNEHERVHLRLPASPAEIGEAFVILDGISLDTTTTAILDVRGNVPGLYRYLYDVDVEDSEQFQKLQQLAERTDALSPEKAAIFSGALDAEHAENLDEALAVANRLDEYMLIGNITSDSELGAYLVDKGITPFPDRFKPYINYARVGAEYREKHDGVYANGSYVQKKVPELLGRYWYSYSPRSVIVFAKRGRNQ